VKGLVVVTATDDEDSVFFHFVDQTMFIIDPSGPAISQIKLEPFGFTDAT
jgi:hypothetical protein